MEHFQKNIMPNGIDNNNNLTLFLDRSSSFNCPRWTNAFFGRNVMLYPLRTNSWSIGVLISTNSVISLKPRFKLVRLDRGAKNSLVRVEMRFLDKSNVLRFGTFSNLGRRVRLESMAFTLASLGKSTSAMDDKVLKSNVGCKRLNHPMMTAMFDFVYERTQYSIKRCRCEWRRS